MDCIIVKVVPIHNSPDEDGVFQLFSSEVLDDVAPVVVPYVSVCYSVFLRESQNQNDKNELIFLVFAVSGSVLVESLAPAP